MNPASDLVIVKTPYRDHGSIATAVSGFELEPGADLAIARSMLERIRADSDLAQLGPPPEGFVRAWLENWPSMLTIRGQRRRLSMRGAACFLRADYVPEPDALASTDKQVLAPAFARLIAAITTPALATTILVSCH